MTDSRSGYDEQLPWLEAVDDEDGPRGVPARRMLGALLVVILAVVLVSGTFFWLGRQNSVEAGGAPQLIKADPNPYKVRPPNPGGLDVAGESQTAFETSAGEDTDAQLDTSKMTDKPVAPPKDEAKPEPAAPPKPAAEPEAARLRWLRRSLRTARKSQQQCAQVLAPRHPAPPSTPPGFRALAPGEKGRRLHHSGVVR